MKLDTNTLEIYYTWQGYQIRAIDPYSPKFHMYITKVYAGQVSWETDYIRAKNYKTEKAARAVVDKLKKGVLENDL